MSDAYIKVNVKVNDKLITIPENRQQPVAKISESRIYAPLREIFEHIEMGFTVTWDSGTVTATNSDYCIKLTNGSNQFEVNGITDNFHDNVRPFIGNNYDKNIVGGSFMIPLRGVFENVGCTVDYKDNTAHVYSSHNTYYKIKNTSGKYLTYLPSLADDDRISVSDLNTEYPDLQIWKIEPSSTTGKYWVKPVRNTSKAMNVYQSSKQGYPNTICYVYDETKSNPNNSEDTSLNFEIVYDSTLNSFYTQKIKWISQSGNVVRYLTCNGEDTYWSTDDNTQIWILEPAYYPSTFQVKDNVTYKIAAFAGSATPNDANNSQYSVKYLTADTMNDSSTDDNGRRVFLSNSTSNNTWKIKFSGNKAHIIASNYPSEGLNYYHKNGLGNVGVCDTIPFEGNSDSFMEFLPLSVESHIPVCKIHLVLSGTDLYLTADNSVNGAGVSWNSLDTDNPNKQLWHLVPINNINNDGNSSNGNESISPHFCWPTESHTITCAFKADKPNKHTGIDIAPLVANKEGDPIYAIADGVVERRFEWNTTDPITGNGSMGRCLFIKHSKTDTNTDYYMRSMYMHLDQMYVSNGQIVHKGDIIGTMGYTGNCVSQYGGNGTHLHFELRIKDTEFSGGSYSSGTPVNPCDNVYEYFDHN